MSLQKCELVQGAPAHELMSGQDRINLGHNQRTILHPNIYEHRCEPCSQTATTVAKRTRAYRAQYYSVITK